MHSVPGSNAGGWQPDRIAMALFPRSLNWKRFKEVISWSIKNTPLSAVSTYCHPFHTHLPLIN